MNTKSVASRLARGSQYLIAVLAAAVVVLVVNANLQNGQPSADHVTIPATSNPPQPSNQDQLFGQMREQQSAIRKALDDLAQRSRAQAVPEQIRKQAENQIAQHQQAIEDLGSPPAR